MHTSCIHTYIVFPVLSARRYIHTYIHNTCIYHAYIHILYSQYSRLVDVYILSYYMHIQLDQRADRRTDRLRAKATIQNSYCIHIQDILGFKKYRFAQIWGGGVHEGHIWPAAYWYMFQKHQIVDFCNGPQDLASHPSVHGNGNSQTYGHPSSTCMVQ